MCMKGGHFDKACELSWAQGNLRANWGLSELRKNLSEPQRAMSFLIEFQGGASAPPIRTAVLGLGPERVWGSVHSTPAALLPAPSRPPHLGRQWVPSPIGLQRHWLEAWGGGDFDGREGPLGLGGFGLLWRSHRLPAGSAPGWS